MKYKIFALTYLFLLKSVLPILAEDTRTLEGLTQERWFNYKNNSMFIGDFIDYSRGLIKSAGDSNGDGKEDIGEEYNFYITNTRYGEFFFTSGRYPIRYKIDKNCNGFYEPYNNEILDDPEEDGLNYNEKFLKKGPPQKIIGEEKEWL